MRRLAKAPAAKRQGDFERGAAERGGARAPTRAAGATRRIVSLVVLALLLAPVARAQEPPPPPEARKLYDAGVQAYEKGRYAEAATAFEQAYNLARRSAIAFALAQALRRQYFLDQDPRRLTRAVELYREYLKLAPAGKRAREASDLLAELGPLVERLRPTAPPPASAPPPPPVTQLLVYSATRGARARLDDGPVLELPKTIVATPGRHLVHAVAPGHLPADVEAVAVEGRLIPVEVRLRELAAVLIFQAPDGAQVAIDGRSFGVAPLAGPLALAPGKHHLAVSQRGLEAWSREVTLTRGEEERVVAAPSATTQRVAARWLLGGGAVALGAAAVSGAFWAGRHSAAEDLRAGLEETGTWSANDLAEYDQLRKTSTTLRNGTIALLLLGVAAGGTGGLLYYYDKPRLEPPPARPVITPSGGQDGFGVEATIPF